MINAITGVPGEGKTCFSVQHIILKELMVGSRPIFSNVAWHKDEVIKFCLSYGFEVDPNRLHTLTEEQIPTFWEHTPHNCLIVLDEVAEFFNSQSWKDIGIKAGAYARQHRKLGHETYLIVQDLGHIYKQFRDMVFEEIRIVNLSNRSFGPFKFPKFFLAKWIIKDTKTVQQTKLYRFNTEVFSTYSTLATVGGVLVTGEDVVVKKTVQKWNFKNSKQKIYNIFGKHWMIISLVIFLFSIVSIPKFLLLDDLNENIAINQNDETTETTIIPSSDSSDTSGDTLFTNFKPKTEVESTYNFVGRYDHQTKREIRQQDTSR